MKRVLFVLGQLDDADIEWMIDHGNKRTLDAGDYLVKQGEPIENIYLILSGQFRIFNEENAEMDIANISSGEIVGEMSFLDDQLPSVSVLAKEYSSVHCIPLHLMKQYMQDNTKFAARFYYSIALFLSDRLRKTTSRLGYGAMEDDVDELNVNVLNQVGKAGARFSRMLNKFAEG